MGVEALIILSGTRLRFAVISEFLSSSFIFQTRRSRCVKWLIITQSWESLTSTAGVMWPRPVQLRWWEEWLDADGPQSSARCHHSGRLPLAGFRCKLSWWDHFFSSVEFIRYNEGRFYFLLMTRCSEYLRISLGYWYDCRSQSRSFLLLLLLLLHFFFFTSSFLSLFLRFLLCILLFLLLLFISTS